MGSARSLARLAHAHREDPVTITPLPTDRAIPGGVALGIIIIGSLP